MGGNPERQGKNPEPAQTRTERGNSESGDLPVVTKLVEDAGTDTAPDDQNGHSEIDRTELRNGGNIAICRLLPDDDMLLPVSPPQPGVLVNCLMLFAGEAELTLSSGETAALTPDRGYNFCFAEETAAYQLKGGQFVHSFGLHAPPDVFEHYLDNDVPRSLWPMLAAPGSGASFMPFPVPKKMRSTLLNAIAPGLTGALRRTQIEGAALLFLSMVEQALAGTDIRPAREGAPREIDAVREASHILRDSLRDPPSLSELAAAVGLSDKRLNTLFREQFSGTVFEVLRGMRLDLARDLLEEGTHSVKEVAWHVGYAHVSNFTSAFSARFGQAPATYARAYNASSEKTGREAVLRAAE